MQCTCPECLTDFEVAEADEGTFLECPTCAMTLMVNEVKGDKVEVKVVELDK